MSGEASSLKVEKETCTLNRGKLMLVQFLEQAVPHIMGIQGGRARLNYLEMTSYAGRESYDHSQPTRVIEFKTGIHNPFGDEHHRLTGEIVFTVNHRDGVDGEETLTPKCASIRTRDSQGVYGYQKCELVDMLMHH